jgi:hypothetical protein
MSTSAYSHGPRALVKLSPRTTFLPRSNTTARAWHVHGIAMELSLQAGRCEGYGWCEETAPRVYRFVDQTINGGLPSHCREHT